jgi:excisionase family DNA binding protein
MLARANRSGDELLGRVLSREEGAWRELVRSNEPALRELFREEMSPSDIDDVLGELWLRIVDDDVRKLRRFALTRPATLDAWLAMQASQVAHEIRQKRGPKTISLDDLPEIADVRREPEVLPRMVRVEEVARRWDLNVKTVYGMIQRGDLASRRCGRVLRVPRWAVESFEQASVAPGGKKPCR